MRCLNGFYTLPVRTKGLAPQAYDIYSKVFRATLDTEDKVILQD